MPELRAGLMTLTLALALALALLVAGAGQAAPSPAAADLIARAGDDLARGDAIAAEVRLGEAQGRGAAREDVAALMGETMLLQQDYRRAREWLGPGAFAPASAARGFRQLGLLERTEGHLAEAGAAYDKALAIAPKDPLLWVDIARLRYSGQEHLLAIEAADYALALAPDNPRALELKGQLVRDAAGMAAALPWFEKGLAAAPDDIGLLGEYAATLGDMGRAKDMLAVVRRMAELDARNPRVFYLQAVLAARAGQFDLARTVLNRAGDRLDDLPGALLLQGALEIEAGSAEHGVDVLERLVQRQPANMRAVNLYARALDVAGEYAYLVQRLGPVADRGEASPYLLTLVGRAHEALGQRDAAAVYLDRAARTTVPFLSPVADGSAAGAAIATGHAAEALVAAEARLGTNPGSAEARMLAADALLAMGRGGEAAEHLAIVAQVRQSDAVLLRQVEALSQAGRGNDAGRVVDDYLARNPQSRVAARLAAGLAAQAGGWPRARGLLEYLARTAAGRDARLLADLAVVRLRAGDADGAARAGQRAWRGQRASPYAAEAWGLALARQGKNRPRAAALLAKARLIMGDTPLLAEGRAALKGR